MDIIYNDLMVYAINCLIFSSSSSIFVYFVIFCIQKGSMERERKSWVYVYSKPSWVTEAGGCVPTPLSLSLSQWGAASQTVTTHPDPQPPARPSRHIVNRARGRGDRGARVPRWPARALWRARVGGPAGSAPVAGRRWEAGGGNPGCVAAHPGSWHHSIHNTYVCIYIH